MKRPGLAERVGGWFVFLSAAATLVFCMMMLVSAIHAAASAESGPVPPPGEPGDSNWAGEVFGIPGVDGKVHAIAFDRSGELYAGGDFYSAGDTAAQSIARWDGEVWRPLSYLEPAAFPGPMVVYALAADTAGDVYVGGTFEKFASGEPLYSIARWDGVTWHALGEGVVGTVHALAVGPDGSVTAGGEFSRAGASQVSNIARWDGHAWHPLGGGLNQPVDALVVGFDGSIYAGGSFTGAGGLAAHHIARWNGAAWQPVGSGTNGPVHALAVAAGGSLYAAGEFTACGSTAAGRIARWDGQSWHAMSSGVDGAIYALAAGDEGVVYAGGQFTTAGGMVARNTARWDGAVWHALESGVDGAEPVVKALALDRRHSVIAGGQFDKAGQEIVAGIARWDENGWRSLGRGNGLNAPVQALLVGPEGQLLVSGEFTVAGTVTASHIARWDGQAWHALGSGIDGTSVRALAADRAGTIYAGGAFRAAGGVAANNVAYWDGNAWHALGPGLTGPVNALALDEAENLVAGGTEITRWDGQAWHRLAEVAGGEVYALAIDESGLLYAGGDFTAVGGTAATYAARWDGDSWTALGAGANGLDCQSVFGPCLGVRALLLDELGNVYAGGDFDQPGFDDIAYWDGEVWQPVGQLTRGPYYRMGIFAMARDNAGNLYAAGDDTPIGGRIARWDGVSWQAMGRGLSSTAAQDTFYRRDLRTVSTLAVDRGGNLYAGGRFNLAGGKLSARIARWTAADGACGLGIGTQTFYSGTFPVLVDITVPGTLDCITVQRFDQSHPRATPSLATGAYWSISSTDANGDPASSYVLDLTLPTAFAPDLNDRMCRSAGHAWICGYTSHTATSITQAGITSLSEWAVQRNTGMVSRWWYPLAFRR